MKTDTRLEFKTLLALLNGEHIEFTKVSIDVFMQLIADHRIIGPVYSKSESLEDIQFKEHINWSKEQNTIGQLQLSKILSEISTQLKAFKTIALKGPALSQYLYNDPAIRSSRDIDLLVKKEDVKNIIETLEKAGYKRKTYYNSPKQYEAILNYYHHIEFTTADEKNLIEIHWETTPFENQSHNFEEISSATDKIKIGSAEYDVIVANKLIEYLAVHGGFHLFFRLQWLHDLKVLFEQLDESEYHSLLNSTNKKNEIFILSALALCDHYFKLSFPNFIQDKIRGNRRLKKYVERCKTAIEANYSGGIDIRSQQRIQRMMSVHRIHFFAGGLKGLLRSLIRRNVRPENWKFFAFPDSVFFLNHLFSRIIWMMSKLR